MLLAGLSKLWDEILYYRQVGVEELISKIEERKAAAKKDRVKSGKTGTETNFGKEYNIAFLPDTDDEGENAGGGGTVIDGGTGGGGNEKKSVSVPVTVDDKVSKIFN